MSTDQRGRQEIREEPLVLPGTTIGGLADKVSGILLTPRLRPGWLIGLGLALLGVAIFLVATVYLFAVGVGVWGIRIPVGWGFAIINYVWWIEIAVGGSILSSFLYLLRVPWRRSLDRFAEIMTLAGFICAGIYPILHLGRPWYFYYLMPYPNPHAFWPQFRSPLFWDFAGITAYGGISLLILFTSLVPDLAVMRDRAKNRFVQIFYGALALGWRGSNREWRYYERARLLLAAALAPTVFGIHSIASLDFAAGIVPDWHSTILPPYFIAEAIMSGLSMALILGIALRRFYKLEAVITLRHLDMLGRVVLGAGIFMIYYFVEELFTSWYGGDPYELYLIGTRLFGPNAFAYWLTIACLAIVPLALLSRRVRTTPLLLFAVALIVNVGSWFDRYFLVVNPLSREFITANWDAYVPSLWDVALYVGTIGLFFAVIFILTRALPLIPLSEMQELIAMRKPADESGPRPGDDAPRPAPPAAPAPDRGRPRSALGD